MLTFRSGGWVLALAGALVLGVLAWGLAGVFLGGGGRAQTRTIEEYGFDLEHPTIPRALIAIGSDIGAIHALERPAMITAAEVDAINERERGKYLVAEDRVIGIELDGESRAYPLRILEWHEIVNDEVNGHAIAVTYNGLCDSAAVFDRVVGDEVVEFEVSGLLYNSNLLMFQRNRDGSRGGESLWSQIMGKAVTGAAAREERALTLLPCAVIGWGEWRRTHPDTLVLVPDPDPAFAERYKRRAYGSYASSESLKFPVEPLPPRTGNGLALKDQVVAVFFPGNDSTMLAIRDLFERDGDGDNAVAIEIGGELLSFELHDNPQSVVVRDRRGNLVPVIYCYWFAWYALGNREDDWER